MAISQCKDAGFNSTKPILLVLDDLMTITQKSPCFEEIQSCGRHYNIEIISTFQSISEKRGNWLSSLGNAAQVIVTRTTQTKAVQRLIYNYLLQLKSISKPEILYATARDLFNAEVSRISYGSILLVYRADKAFNCADIRTEYFNENRQFVYDISDDGMSYIKKTARRVDHNSTIFEIEKSNINYQKLIDTELNKKDNGQNENQNAFSKTKNDRQRERFFTDNGTADEFFDDSDANDNGFNRKRFRNACGQSGFFESDNGCDKDNERNEVSSGYRNRRNNQMYNGSQHIINDCRRGDCGGKKTAQAQWPTTI